MRHRELRIFEDLDAMAISALQTLLSKINEVLSEKDQCVLVLAGGTSPRKLYTYWATEGRAQTPWQQLEVFWSDERYVPPTHPASNDRMVTESLLQKVPIPESNVHPIPTDLSPIHRCPTAYEEVLRSYGGVDIALLGVGPDGHTASIFPGHPVIHETKRWVVAIPEPIGNPSLPRITLTIPALSRAKWVLFWVAGTSKKQVIHHLLRQIQGGHKLPPFPALQVFGKKATLWFIVSSALPNI